MADPDPLTILIDGRRYGGWISPTITRSLEQCAASFEVRHSDRVLGQPAAWPLRPFSAVQVLVGNDLLVTGYIDVLDAGLEPAETNLQFAGRSKTADLVDCVTEIEGGEFRGGTLASIARALASKFGIDVADEVNDGTVFPVQGIEPSDRAFTFLEELARMRGVLLTDDEQGRLVITRTGSGRASGSLRQGVNIMAARMRTNVSKRFSRYVVRAQAGIAASLIPWNAQGQALPPGGGVVTNIVATATDPQVPRYRPMAVSAEGATDNTGALQRARWEASSRAGQSVQIEVTVSGWRQPDGRLWRINELVPVAIPRWGLDETLLIVSTTHRLDPAGRVTVMTLGAPAGYQPAPLQTRGNAALQNFLAQLLANSGRI